MACSRISPMNDLDARTRMTRSTGHRQHDLPSTARSRSRQSTAAGAADGAGVCSRLADLCCSPAASRWARGETIRSSRRSWRLPSSERDFVPSLRVATVEASPGTVSVTLPGTTAAFAAANIYARATGYIAKRNVDIGDHVKAGDLLAQLAVPELDAPDFAERGDARSAQVGAGAGGGQPRARAGDMGPRRASGQQRLGDPAAGHGRRPDRQGAGGRGRRRAT